MYHFFGYMARMKHIKRWGLMRNTRDENIQEHSLQAAMIAHALAVIKNALFGGNMDAERVMALAVYHEAGEVITGDLATPIKYFNPEINNAYKQIERVAEDKLLGMLPDELREAYAPLVKQRDDDEAHAIVKAADKLSAYIKCVEELKAGNLEFREAAEQTRRTLEGYGLPEVAYFLETFIDSFSLTLDQLK